MKLNSKKVKGYAGLSVGLRYNPSLKNINILNILQRKCRVVKGYKATLVTRERK